MVLNVGKLWPKSHELAAFTKYRSEAPCMVPGKIPMEVEAKACKAFYYSIISVKNMHPRPSLWKDRQQAGDTPVRSVTFPGILWVERISDRSQSESGAANRISRLSAEDVCRDAQNNRCGTWETGYASNAGTAHRRTTIVPVRDKRNLRAQLIAEEQTDESRLFPGQPTMPAHWRWPVEGSNTLPALSLI